LCANDFKGLLKWISGRTDAFQEVGGRRIMRLIRTLDANFSTLARRAR